MLHPLVALTLGVFRGHLISPLPLPPYSFFVVKQGCTLSCEPGPFWTTDAPLVPSGSLLAKSSTEGEPLFFSATVKNTKGEAIEGVIAEVVRPTLLTLLPFHSTRVLLLLIPTGVIWLVWRGVAHGRCLVCSGKRTEKAPTTSKTLTGMARTIGEES